MEKITDREWEKFFEILDKIVGVSETWQDKRDYVHDKSEEYGSTGNLEEFSGWFGNY